MSQPHGKREYKQHMSRHTTKPTKWYVPSAKTQISLGIRPFWSESSLCTQWVAKDPSFFHVDSEESGQTGRMPRLIWVFAGRTCHFVGFVMRGAQFISTPYAKIVLYRRKGPSLFYIPLTGNRDICRTRSTTINWMGLKHSTGTCFTANYSIFDHCQLIDLLTKISNAYFLY